VKTRGNVNHRQAVRTDRPHSPPPLFNENARKRICGFTLVELMTVVAVMGILSAVAIPAFISYIQKAKTAEATSNVQKIYSGIVTYYASEHVKRGMAADTIVTRRLPNEYGTSDWCPLAPPTAKKYPAPDITFYNSVSTQGKIWKAVDFAIADHHYYHYRIEFEDWGGSDAFIGEAEGDLDGDTALSRFERTGFVGPNDIIVGSAGIYQLNPLD